MHSKSCPFSKEQEKKKLWTNKRQTTKSWSRTWCFEWRVRTPSYSNSSSRLLDVVGVAGLESCEMEATVTILGEPSASSTSSSMSSVVRMASAAPPFLPWWVLMCFDRWSLLMNLLEHSGHSNLFSPEGHSGGSEYFIFLWRLIQRHVQNDTLININERENISPHVLFFPLRHAKPAKRIFWNCCSGCITGRIYCCFIPSSHPDISPEYTMVFV